jgi:WD40 repeat protein
MNGKIVAGSHRGKEPLQIFDIGMRKLMYSVDWEATGSYWESSFLYSAKFAKDNTDIVIAGGSGGSVRMFEHSDEEESYRIVSKVVTSMEKGCLSLDLSENNKLVALGLGNGTIKLMNLNLEHKEM